MINVFLSHSDKDKKIAADLKSILSKHGIKVFLAHEDIDIGTDWMEEFTKKFKNVMFFTFYFLKIIMLQILLIKRLELH